MKSVLEIPVLAAHKEIINRIFTLDKKEYHNFSLMEYPVDNTRSVYFYILNALPEPGNEMLLDQIIPKAPFAMVILDPLEDLNESKNGEMCRQYYEKYETPLVFLVLTGDEQLLSNFQNDALISEHEARVVLADPDQPQVLKSVLTTAINTMISK